MHDEILVRFEEGRANRVVVERAEQPIEIDFGEEGVQMVVKFFRADPRALEANGVLEESAEVPGVTPRAGELRSDHCEGGHGESFR